MTHDDARDALEYAALLLEQEDAGGMLPGTLRQIADSHSYGYYTVDYTDLAALLPEIRAAIAAARGKEEDGA